MKPVSTFHPIRDGLAAARANLVPGLFLQAFLLSLVLCYFFWTPSRPLFDALARLKLDGGWAFSALSTALFGGLIPFLVLRLGPQTKKDTPWSFLVFYLVFWAYKGVEIDLLYRFVAGVFGSDNQPSTVVAKVLVDQFVYNPFWAAPIQTLAFHFLNSKYSPRAFSNYPWREFLFQKVPTTLISVWGVWIPLVTLVYLLPSPLQLPVSNLALCFWVLLSTALLRPKTQ